MSLVKLANLKQSIRPIRRHLNNFLQSGAGMGLIGGSIGGISAGALSKDKNKKRNALIGLGIGSGIGIGLGFKAELGNAIGQDKRRIREIARIKRDKQFNKKFSQQFGEHNSSNFDWFDNFWRILFSFYRISVDYRA